MSVPLTLVDPNDPNIELIRLLSDRIYADSGEYESYDNYYDGAFRLLAMGLALPPEMRLLITIVNWPRLVVDSIAERMTVTGFRVGESAETDKRLWSWWQANNLDDDSRLEHIEFMVQRRGYVVVGPGEDDPDVPLITVETRKNMGVLWDAKSRQVTAALRLYGYQSSDEPNDPTALPGQPQYATLYLPDVTHYYVYEAGGWHKYDETTHQLGRVPVVPMVNRARIGDRRGRSEMDDVIGITDAAARALTNLQAAQELLAVPQRYLLGATLDDFKDAGGKVIPAWEAYIGRYAMLANDQAKAGQFPAAELSNFTEVFNLYSKLVASVSGLPPHFLGMAADNPASADAIRSSEARLVMRCYDRMTAASGTWEEAMRLGIGWVDGTIPPETAALETVWASPETPTFAARADAVSKLVMAGIMPPDAALEELGFSDIQRARWAKMRSSDPIAQMAVAMTNGSTPTQPNVHNQLTAAPAPEVPLQ